MANNVQTAAEWDQVIDNLDLIKKSTLTQLTEVRNTLSELQSRQQVLASRMAAADLAGDTDLFAVLKQQNDTLSMRVAGTNIGINKLQADIAETDREINEAFDQKFKADSGLPTALSTTSPVSTPDANGVVVTPVPDQTPNTSSITLLEDGDPAVTNTSLLTPDGIDEGEGDASTGLTEPPVDDDTLRTPTGAIEEEGDAGTGLTEPPVDDDTTAYRGPSRDDDGNLLPGWEEGEFGDQYVGGDYASVPTRASAEVSRAEKTTPKLSAPKDWRVRISLAPGANYLYGADKAGILSPLKTTGGVIFPYTPSIQVNYAAKYDTQSPTHSNYNIYNYQGSSVDGLTVNGEFTAQSVTEANYLLAVIHFFRSATKMFYGQDAQRGTPPPLLYLSGYGQYQFDNHPMVLTSFNYSLPQDVDYVDAYSLDEGSTPSTAINGVSLTRFVEPNKNIGPAQNILSSLSRLISGKAPLEPGGKATPNSFKKSPDSIKSITRVPSKISISLSLQPMITRRAINDHFSLKEYATGKLLRGSTNKGTGGGIW